MRAGLSRENAIAGAGVIGIALYFVLRYPVGTTVAQADVVLWAVLAAGAVPLLADLGRRLWQRQFGSDLLAGISIISAAIARQPLVGAIIVVMLAGGSSLEQMATGHASQVLDALARRMPQIAHRLRANAEVEDVSLDLVAVGDRLLVLPHEVCPADGIVAEGHSTMDESYLTGEPFAIAKAPGARVFSGTVNGETALTITADRRARDSRYAKIMAVMAETAQRQPRLRRLGDRLGAWYTPLAVGIAAFAWGASGDGLRFLAVIVIATPCPLLLAIPVAVVGSISLAAKHGIIIKNPGALELAHTCRTIILDKTGTLTYGRPALTGIHLYAGFERIEALRAAASLERYSKHPLAQAVLRAARAEGASPGVASSVSEPPGQGLTGVVENREVRITGRGKLVPALAEQLPPPMPGLEFVLLLDHRLAAVFHFRDEPRPDIRPLIGHFGPRHRIERIQLVSGDRYSEVRYLADQAGIREIHAEQTPEQKLVIVKQAMGKNRTLFVGDGINDAPALAAATVGLAFGPGSDIASEAADAVILDPSLRRVDQFLHIGRRMRAIALQSAVFGMGASLVGMAAAAVGWLPPLAGAISQEGVDLLAVLNAVRATFPGGQLTDLD